MKILTSFLAVVLLGAFLLSLPISSKNGEWLSLVDALFASASSVCITGLATISNYGASFTVFGKIVIALLIEIGGLSVLTLTIFAFVLLGKKVGIKDRFLMKEALGQSSSSGIVKLILTIVKYTLIIQSVGAILVFISLVKYYPVGEAIGISLFHSIASFNNSGIDIFGYDNSVAVFSHDIFFSITTMLLIILGSLGFVVLKDIFSRKRPNDYMLITKIVLPMTAILIIAGMLLLKLALGSEITWLQALFQGISARTAGFSVYNLGDLNNAEYSTYIILMMIGGSPCSTSGGLKTTTVFVIIITVVFYAAGKDPHVFRRQIPKRSIFKAFSLVALVIGYLCINILVLAFLEPTKDFAALIFEAVAAISNAGLSTGITNTLKPASKLLLALSMFIGRLGPMTVLNMLNKNWIRESTANIKYVEENILIG